MRTLWDYVKEQQPEQELDSDEVSKDREIEKEQQEILRRVSSFYVNTVRDRVAWILNYHPETRDSDIALQLKYWENFESDIYNGHSIAPEDLFRLTRLTTLARARAKLQNEYKLFLASTEVRQRRGTLSEEEKEKAVQDKPSHPVFIVYMDDSGKTARNLIIGSVWFLADFPLVFFAINKIKEQRNFRREFHFKELKHADLSVYREVVDVFLEHANAVSFKLITIPRTGIGNITTALTDLYYHLLVRGIEHEHETGRAPLPRKLQVWIDAEEAGLDRLRLASLDDRLKQAAQTRFGSELEIDRVESGESKTNLFLQIADLFAGSVNRILNSPGTTRNHKDEFAEHLLNSVRIDFELPQNEQIEDMAFHISL